MLAPFATGAKAPSSRPARPLPEACHLRRLKFPWVPTYWPARSIAAALAVIREWRLLPRVRHGVPVETQATMPFDCTPPKPK